MDENINESDNQMIKELESVKQKAVDALAGIIGQIDYSTTQEKFEAAMSTLKYGANSNLANIALEAALSTEDKKQKSDMLIQIISEIGYLEDSIK